MNAFPQTSFYGTQTITSQNFPNGAVIKSGAIITMNGNFKVGKDKRIYIESGGFLIVQNATIESISGYWTGIEMSTLTSYPCNGGNHFGVRTIHSSIRDAWVGIRNIDLPIILQIPSVDVKDAIGGFVDVDDCIFNNRWADIMIYNEIHVCGMIGEIKNSTFQYMYTQAHNAIAIQNSSKVIRNNFFLNNTNGFANYAIILYNFTGDILNNSFGNCNVNSTGISSSIRYKQDIGFYTVPHPYGSISLRVLNNNFGGVNQSIFVPANIDILSINLNIYNYFCNNIFNRNGATTNPVKFNCPFFGEFSTNELTDTKLLLSNTNPDGQNVGFNTFLGDLNKIETIGNLRNGTNGQGFYCNKFISTANNTTPDISLGGNIIKEHGYFNSKNGNYLCLKNEYTQSAKSFNSSGLQINYYHSGSNYVPVNNTGLMALYYNSLSQTNLCLNLTNSLPIDNSDNDEATLKTNLFNDIITADENLTNTDRTALLSDYYDLINIKEVLEDAAPKEIPCLGEYLNLVYEKILTVEDLEKVQEIESYLNELEADIINEYDAEEDEVKKSVGLNTIQKIRNGIVDRLMIDQMSHVILGDTIDMDTFSFLARKYHNIMSEYKIAEMYFRQNNWEEAKNVFDSLPNFYLLDSAAQADRDNMILLLNVFITAKNAERTLQQLIQTEISTLQSIVNSNTVYASKMACRTLDLNEQNCSNESQITYDENEYEEELIATVYPVPEVDEFINIQAEFIIAYVEIYDQNGNLMLTASPNEDNYIMEVSSLETGNYILVLHNSLDQKRSFYIIKQ